MCMHSSSIFSPHMRHTWLVWVLDAVADKVPVADTDDLDIRVNIVVFMVDIVVFIMVDIVVFMVDIAVFVVDMVVFVVDIVMFMVDVVFG